MEREEEARYVREWGECGIHESAYNGSIKIGNFIW